MPMRKCVPLTLHLLNVVLYFNFKRPNTLCINKPTQSQDRTHAYAIYYYGCRLLLRALVNYGDLGLLPGSFFKFFKALLDALACLWPEEGVSSYEKMRKAMSQGICVSTFLQLTTLHADLDFRSPISECPSK